VTVSEFETLIYEYADICFKIGRMETDGNTSQKTYDKLTDKRDEIRSTIIQLFKGKHVNIHR
jgi:hypothetical protein